MKIVEIDYTTTPETILERNATKSEIAQWDADLKAENERIAILEKKEADRLALLTRLGINEEEARILFS